MGIILFFAHYHRQTGFEGILHNVLAHIEVVTVQHLLSNFSASNTLLIAFSSVNIRIAVLTVLFYSITYCHSSNSKMCNKGNKMFNMLYVFCGDFCLEAFILVITFAQEKIHKNSI
jgi:FtsH-binding integral membrane protein